LGIGTYAGGIIVGRTGNQSWPENLKDSFRSSWARCVLHYLIDVCLVGSGARGVSATNRMKDFSSIKNRFASRRKLLTVKQDAMALARRVKELLGAGDKTALRALLDEQHPADLADAVLFLTKQDAGLLFGELSVAEAAELLDEVDLDTRSELLREASPAFLAEILEELPADEGADVLYSAPPEKVEAALRLTEPGVAQAVQNLFAYPPETAGGIMSTGYIDVSETATQAEALKRFRERHDAEHIFYVYVVDEDGRLCGAVDLRTLLSADEDAIVSRLMQTDLVTVEPRCDQEQVAHIFARYDLNALAVVDPSTQKMLGIVTADDVIDVIEAEYMEDIAHITGSEAGDLERKSPAQIARLRLPWIMTTMFIELLAGFVIHVFDKTLATVILLASFMPIISAISGNTGLQSAAIIIRGLSTGHVQLDHWRHAVRRQLETTLILGGACAVVLGLIGWVWEGRIAFGITVMTGMFISVNIAGVVGTVIPLLSKKLGYDPALTAGPFETAFQDVIGISIFLAIATLLMQWIK
jgi:magnesium transporter